MKITQEFIRDLRDELNAAVAKVGEKHNLAIRFENAKYDDSSIDFNVKTVVLGEGETNMEEALFRQYAPLFGFREKDYGKVFFYGENKFKLIGFNPKARKYPVLARDISNDTCYKLPLDALS